MLRTLLQNVLAVCVLAVAASALPAQQLPPDCVEWKTYTDMVWVEQDVTENRLVSETSYETKEVAKSRPRWISEELQRTVTEEKPVQQTSERVVTRTVRKPVTTTKTRIKKRVEETYEDVTEMRDETFTVRKPVVETVMERKEVKVRKPVTRRTIEKENVTVYRPQEVTQTTMVPGTLVVPGQTSSSRPRMRWLQRGYYSDPYSGQPVWRRTGLHWVDEPRYGQTAVPVVVPQQRSAVTLVPQTIVEERPVEETTYVDQYEVREVPVEVERMVEETRTRKVPYTVRVPKRRVIEEEVPYTETTYVDETITERIPYTETVMKKVTRTEPYTRMKQKWEDYTETVRVPKTTTRRVPYVAKYRVPYLVEVRVPVDANGRPVARGQQVPGTHRLHPAWRKMITKVVGEGGSSRVVSESSVLVKPEPAAASFSTSGSVEAPASASSVLSGKTEDDSVPTSVLGEAPKNLRFRDGRSVTVNETSDRLKPIGQRKAVKQLVQEPQETEASKELSRRIDERFRMLGIGSSEKEAETQQSVLTAETSDRQSDGGSTETPVAAKAEFQPEPLSVDVELAPEAAQPVTASTSPDAEPMDDDTIERDVKISRE